MPVVTHRLASSSSSGGSSDGGTNSDAPSSDNNDPDSDEPSDDDPDSGIPDTSSKVEAVVFTDKKDQTTIPEGKTVFSANSIYSVYICATWKNIEGSHDEVLKLYCPDGRLYQTVYLPFTTYPLSSMTKSVAWSPHPVEIELVSQINGVYPVWGELPVAGTWAMRLTGAWRAEIYLDDNPTCYGQASFTLNP